MTTKSKNKSKARELQQRTGWHYAECLRCVRTLTPAEIEELIRKRTEEK